jgi:hypothetical protein
MKYVCVWEMSEFDTDEDGGDYSLSYQHSLTNHETLESAIEKAGTEFISENGWQPIFCNTILEYFDNKLVATYRDYDYSGWRKYPTLN